MPMPAHELAFDAPLLPAPMLRQDLDSQAADALLAMSGAPQAEDQKPSLLSRSSGGGGDGGEMHSGDGGFHMGDPQHGGVPPLPGLDMAGSGGAGQVRSQPTLFPSLAAFWRGVRAGVFMLPRSCCSCIGLHQPLI